MGLASKGPSLPLPQAWSSSWLPLLVLLCARVRVFGVGVEVEKKELKFDQGCIRKTRFMLCLRVLAPQALARRWPGASPLTSGASRRWLGAGQALGSLFWENGHCDFIHRWIELKF